jgi:hypothetical protein
VPFQEILPNQTCLLHIKDGDLSFDDVINCVKKSDNQSQSLLRRMKALMISTDVDNKKNKLNRHVGGLTVNPDELFCFQTML